MSRYNINYEDNCTCYRIHLRSCLWVRKASLKITFTIYLSSKIAAIVYAWLFQQIPIKRHRPFVYSLLTVASLTPSASLSVSFHKQIKIGIPLYDSSEIFFCNTISSENSPEHVFNRFVFISNISVTLTFTEGVIFRQILIRFFQLVRVNFLFYIMLKILSFQK